jgi:type IV pilus assembly protein PilC
MHESRYKIRKGTGMQENTQQKTLPPEETALFCEQVAMVLKAGIPLGDGIETLARSYADSRYGERFEQMRIALERRGTLSAALQDAGLFPGYMLAMTRIGERSGKLDEVMASLANYYQWEAQIKTSVKNAILYPSVLVMMLAVVIAILVISVIPVFQRVFDSLGLAAGSPASAAMQIGVGVGKSMLILVGVFALVLIGVGILLRTSRRESVLALLSGILPPVRRVNARLSTARYASALSMMLAAGYPVEDAIQLAPSVVTDEKHRRQAELAQNELLAGGSFPQAAEKSGLFDPMHEKMIRFGTAAGKLDAVMDKLSGVYMSEADDAIHNVIAMIEPTLVAVLSIVIGGILLSVMLPLLSVLSAVG